jgi:acyl-CoA dehydrogenase
MDIETRGMLLETAGRLFADKATKDVVNGLETGTWPAALWQALEEMGLPAVAVSEDNGGTGGTVGDLCAVAKLGAYHALPLPLGDTALAAMLLDQAGIAPPSGAMALAIAGNDADLRISGAAVSGRARRVAFASMVATLVVVAPGTDGKAQIATVPVAQARIERHQGHAGEPYDTVIFEAAATSHHAPSPVDAARAREFGAVLRCAQMAGAAKRVLDLAVTYAKERVQFGRPIGNFQAIQQLLAELASYIAAVSAAADTAARDAEEGGTFSIAAAKAQAGEVAPRICGIAHQCMGAMGFTHEHVLHHYTRRLWVWRRDFGSDGYWATRVGEVLAKGGADGLWPALVESRAA